jgi:hypothetical protein
VFAFFFCVPFFLSGIRYVHDPVSVDCVMNFDSPLVKAIL